MAFTRLAVPFSTMDAVEFLYYGCSGIENRCGNASPFNKCHESAVKYRSDCPHVVLRQSHYVTLCAYRCQSPRHLLDLPSASAVVATRLNCAPFDWRR